jgi:hypothetical protein
MKTLALVVTAGQQRHCQATLWPVVMSCYCCTHSSCLHLQSDSSHSPNSPEHSAAHLPRAPVHRQRRPRPQPAVSRLVQSLQVLRFRGSRLVQPVALWDECQQNVSRPGQVRILVFHSVVGQRPSLRPGKPKTGGNTPGRPSSRDCGKPPTMYPSLRNSRRRPPAMCPVTRSVHRPALPWHCEACQASNGYSCDQPVQSQF